MSLRKCLAYLLLTFVWLCPVAGYGLTSTEQVLELHTGSGKVIQFLLDERPVTTFSDGMLNVSAGDFSASYPLSDVLRYTYSSRLSSLETVDADNVKIGYVNSVVHVSGLADGSRVTLYKIDGTVVKSVVAESRNAVMDLTGMASGVYIVSAGDARLKIVK